MKVLTAVGLSLVLVLGLAACNTIEGAGKDLERGGEKVQDAAQDTRRKM